MIQQSHSWAYLERTMIQKHMHLNVYLLVPASKIHKRESPRRGTLRYSNGRRRPNVDGASSLSGALLVFHITQVNQPLLST